jgi:hypothetical protein
VNQRGMSPFLRFNQMKGWFSSLFQRPNPARLVRRIARRVLDHVI